MTNIYVGNLPFSTSEDEVRNLFSAYGTVDNVSLIADRETGRLRGFGFVEMSSGGDEAIAALNQTELGGRRCGRFFRCATSYRQYCYQG